MALTIAEREHRAIAAILSKHGFSDTEDVPLSAILDSALTTLKHEVERLRDAALVPDEHLRDALEWIAAQENLTFAECSLAEEIISRAKSTLARVADPSGPTAGDQLLAAVEKFVTHAERCDVDACAECDVNINQLRLARKVWLASEHKRLSSETASRVVADPPGVVPLTWQPIETYSGSDYVLLLSPAHGRVIGAHVTGDVWHLVGVGAVTSTSERPTHWAPLPDPPKTVARAERSEQEPT